MKRNCSIREHRRRLPWLKRTSPVKPSDETMTGRYNYDESARLRRNRLNQLWCSWRRPCFRERVCELRAQELSLFEEARARTQQNLFTSEGCEYEKRPFRLCFMAYCSDFRVVVKHVEILIGQNFTILSKEKSKWHKTLKGRRSAGLDEYQAKKDAYISPIP